MLTTGVVESVPGCEQRGPTITYLQTPLTCTAYLLQLAHAAEDPSRIAIHWPVLSVCCAVRNCFYFLLRFLFVVRSHFHWGSQQTIRSLVQTFSLSGFRQLCVSALVSCAFAVPLVQVPLDVSVSGGF